MSKPSDPPLPGNNASQPLGAVTKIAPIKIGVWTLDPGLGRISHQSGEHKHLTPKTLQVLLALLQYPGTTITRTELLESIWGSTYPSDYVVSRAIADLRSAFGEEAKSAGYIETVPKIGYRLIAPVSPVMVVTTQRWQGWYLTAALLLTASALLLVMPGGSNTQIDWPVPIPITSGPGLEQQSRIAAQGKWLIYASLERGDSDWNIYRQSLAGGVPEPVAVSEAVEYGPAISPDAKEIAYVRLVDQHCEVVWQAMHQGEPQTLTPCTTKFPTFVDWSPDGRQIAFTSPADTLQDRRSIHLVDKTSGLVVALSHGVSEDGTDYYPRFSPDGRQLAFLRGVPRPDHRSHIWVVDLDTGKQNRITANDSTNAGLAWLDSGHLLYVVRDGGRLVTKLADLKTGQLETLPLRDLFQPDFHAASKSLTMSKVNNVSDLMVLELSDRKASFIADSTFNDWDGELSPDGRWMAFVSTRTGSNQLWLAAVETGTFRQLTQLENVNIQSPRWSQDSETLLFSVDQKNQQQLFTTHIITGNTQALDTGNFAANSARWLPDSDDIVFSCQDDRGWKLCRVMSESNEVRIMLDMAAYDPMVDRQGQQIYFTRDQPGLWAFNIETEAVELIWAGLPSTLGPGWTVHQESIYYIRSLTQPDVAQIERRELATGNTTILYRGIISSFDLSLSINQNGTQLVFPSWRAAQDDIVLIKPFDPI